MIWKIWKKSKLKIEKKWKIRRKSKLNSEKIWKIWEKGKLNSEIIWKIWKIYVLVIITPIETCSSSTTAAALLLRRFHRRLHHRCFHRRLLRFRRRRRRRPHPPPSIHVYTLFFGIEKKHPGIGLFGTDYASRDQIYHFIHLTLRLFSTSTVRT